jgi:hypothetical protein
MHYLWQKWVGPHFGRFCSKTHLVTLLLFLVSATEPIPRKQAFAKKKILIGPLYESYTFVKKNVSWFYARLARVLFQEPILRPRITTPAFIFFTTALGSLERFGNKNILLNSEKRSSLLQRWRCSCKFKSRRIGSKFEYFGPYTTPGAQ